MTKTSRHSLSSKTFDASHIKIYEKRAKQVRLKWCSQVASIMKKKNPSENVKINDLGCNYFQLYKELKLQKLNYNYKGYDIDKKYINIGLSHFPELRKKYEIANIENNKPRICNISVASAILEHASNPEKFLNNMVSTTKDILILRTFFGNKNEVKLVNSYENVISPYYINQFAFHEMIDYFLKKNFKTEFYLDRATANSKRIEIFKNSNIYRQSYILVATKNKL